MNQVNLIGRITKDPEIKYLPDGTGTVAFNVAIDRGYKDKNGNRVTDFIGCVAWKNQAEFISKYVKKGNLLEIVGNIQTRSYQTNDGQMRVITEVNVTSVGNLTPKSENEQAQPKPQPKPQGVQYNETSEQFPDLEDEFADLPF